jgi:hypothetical protein
MAQDLPSFELWLSDFFVQAMAGKAMPKSPGAISVELRRGHVLLYRGQVSKTNPLPSETHKAVGRNLQFCDPSPGHASE